MESMLSELGIAEPVAEARAPGSSDANLAVPFDVAIANAALATRGDIIPETDAFGAPLAATPKRGMHAFLAQRPLKGRRPVWEPLDTLGGLSVPRAAWVR